MGGSERTKRQRKGVARWSDDPLSSLNLGGSRGKLEAAYSGKGGAQGPVSSESAGDNQFLLLEELLNAQRKTRGQQQLKRKHAEIVDISSNSDSDDIFADKPTSTPGNPKAARARGTTAAAGRRRARSLLVHHP